MIRKIIISVLLWMTFYVGNGQAQLKPQFDSAVRLLKSENLIQAEKSFSNLLSKVTDPGLKKYCLIYRAFCYSGLGNYQKAVADLDKVIGMDPSDLASYIDRGKTKVYANDLEGAKKDFQYTLSKDTTSEQGEAALYYLAKIAHHEGKFEESIKYYDRYVVLIPDDPEVYFNRGAAKGMLLDHAGAIKDYDKAILLDSTFKEAYANRGVAKINLLTKKGNIQPTKAQTSDACTDLKKAKQLGDDTVDDMIFVYCDKQ